MKLGIPVAFEFDKQFKTLNVDTETNGMYTRWITFVNGNIWKKRKKIEEFAKYNECEQ